MPGRLKATVVLTAAVLVSVTPAGAVAAVSGTVTSQFDGTPVPNFEVEIYAVG
ncbi:MAG: hypothetical protein QOF58_3747, partial [Pseudonocardiales bacterium]|nr:hypothetical protein [Pseudonocardiales bacterium]